MNATTLTGKTLLVVDTGPLKKKFIFQRLKKLGIKIVVMHHERNWAVPFVDHWILTDNYSHREAIANLQNFIKQHPKIKIDGVLTFWEDHVLLTSKIVDKFNFIGIPFAIAKNVRNKFRFREFCAENGLKTPQHKLISSARDLPGICKNFSFPLVIKPAYGGDSVFVMKVNDREQLYKTFNYITNNINADSEETSSLMDGMEIFVEEYIDGDEVDIDIILQNGKIKFYSIADNFNKNRDQFFLDSGQAIPSGLPAQDQEALIEMASETLEKLGIQNGCIHFEAKLTKTGPVPIEINLRMGGDYVYSYIKGVWDVDMIAEAVKVSLGVYTKIEKPEKPHKYIVGWDLHPESSGILVELDIEKELYKKSYLEEINLYKEVGDAVLLPPEGYELMGWLTISGDNLLDAQDNLKEALEFIRYKAVEFDEESSVGQTSRRDKFSVAVLNKNLVLQAAKMAKLRRTVREDQRALHIGILSDSEDGGEAILANLARREFDKRGYQISVISTNNISRMMSDLRWGNINLVLNLSKGLEHDLNLQPQIIALLEAFHISYIGTNSLNLALNCDRIRTRKLYAYHNIPTPTWDYINTETENITDKLVYPVILKPAYFQPLLTHEKIQIAKTEEAAYKLLPELLSSWKTPVFLSEYIAGDEYHVFILGTDKSNWRVLPLTRVLFHSKQGAQVYMEHDQRITPQCPPKNMSSKLESLITEIALDAYRVAKFRDYGEIRIRVDQDDNPYVISCNAVPDISPHAPLIKAAERMGMNYGDLLEELISLSIQRYKDKKFSGDYL